MFFKRKPVVTPPPEKRISASNITPQDRATLIQLQSHPGYEVLTRLMTNVCESFEAALINADGANPQDVIAKQAQAKAAYTFLNTVLAKIDFEVGEFKADSAPEPAEEEEYTFY